MHLVTWLYTVNDYLRGLVPFLSLPSHHFLFNQNHALYFHSILVPCQPWVLMQPPVLKVCVAHTQSPFSTKLHHSSALIIISWNSKSNRALALSPIYPFRSPRLHNLYPLLTLSRILSISFQSPSLSSPSPSLGVIPHHQTNLTLENLNLTQRILQLTQVISLQCAIYHSTE